MLVDGRKLLLRIVRYGHGAPALTTVPNTFPVTRLRRVRIIGLLLSSQVVVKHVGYLMAGFSLTVNHTRFTIQGSMVHTPDYDLWRAKNRFGYPMVKKF